MPKSRVLPGYWRLRTNKLVGCKLYGSSFSFHTQQDGRQMPRVGCLALLGRVGALSARGLVWNLAAGFAGACRAGVAVFRTVFHDAHICLSGDALACRCGVPSRGSRRRPAARAMALPSFTLLRPSVRRHLFNRRFSTPRTRAFTTGVHHEQRRKPLQRLCCP